MPSRQRLRMPVFDVRERVSAMKRGGSETITYFEFHWIKVKDAHLRWKWRFYLNWQRNWK